VVGGRAGRVDGATHLAGRRARGAMRKGRGRGATRKEREGKLKASACPCPFTFHLHTGGRARALTSAHARAPRLRRTCWVTPSHKCHPGRSWAMMARARAGRVAARCLPLLHRRPPPRNARSVRPMRRPHQGHPLPCPRPPGGRQRREGVAALRCTAHPRRRRRRPRPGRPRCPCLVALAPAPARTPPPLAHR